MSQVFKVDGQTSESEVQLSVEAAIATVKDGGLAVIPTDTSYALICDAFNAGAITKLRIAKNQNSDIALPIAGASIETIRGVANFSTIANDLASALWPGALTVLTAAQSSLSWKIGQVGSALAVRVPYHKVAQAVLSGIGPTVMTGAQLAGQAAVQTLEQAQNSLGESVDVYLDGGHLMGANSTVIDATTDNLRLIRAGAISLERIRQVLPGVIDASATT